MSLATLSTSNYNCRDPKLLAELHAEIDADIQLEPQDYDPDLDDSVYQDWFAHQLEEFDESSCFDDDYGDDYSPMDDWW